MGSMVEARLGSKGLRVQMVAAGHTFAADEPVAAGGTGAGPGPYELLLSALGS